MSPTTPLTSILDEGYPLASPAPALDTWRDEGGTGAPSRRAPRGKTPARTRSGDKDRRDTAAGCRERAAADLLQSVSMLIANERRRMESSAASWTARAELLQRLETSFEARQVARGETPDGEDPSALRT